MTQSDATNPTPENTPQAVDAQIRDAQIRDGQATSATVEQSSNSPEIESVSSDDDLLALRSILFQSERQHLDALRAAVTALEHRTSDDSALIESITPVMGDIIREKIRNNRDEMIEALYPIIGQLVVRAVTEAVRDLARSVDAQMRTTFSFDTLWYYLRARTVGVSSAEAIMRHALAFSINEVFLIHRETGLVLWSTSQAAEGGQASADSEIMGGMLTAIRDFAADTIGQGREGQLDEIRYGNQEILIETVSDVYAAVVFEGVEPVGFREQLRSRLVEFSNQHQRALQKFSGDATIFASDSKALATALTNFVQEKQTTLARR